MSRLSVRVCHLRCDSLQSPHFLRALFKVVSLNRWNESTRHQNPTNATSSISIIYLFWKSFPWFASVPSRPPWDASSAEYIRHAWGPRPSRLSHVLVALLSGNYWVRLTPWWSRVLQIHRQYYRNIESTTKHRQYYRNMQYLDISEGSRETWIQPNFLTSATAFQATFHWGSCLPVSRVLCHEPATCMLHLSIFKGLYPRDEIDLDCLGGRTVTLRISAKCLDILKTWMWYCNESRNMLLH